jgi:hypothetical protein
VILLKSVVAGVLGAIVFTIALVFSSIAIPMAFFRLHGQPMGGGAGIAAVSSGISEVLLTGAPLLGFAAAFYWMWRRSTSRAARLGR